MQLVETKKVGPAREIIERGAPIAPLIGDLDVALYHAPPSQGSSGGPCCG